MVIVQIEKTENGGHANTISSEVFPAPDGWAVIPDDLETPNFPFGEIVVEDGVVTSWEPLPIPEPEPEPSAPPTLEERVEAVENGKADKSEVDAVWDQMAQAYGEGVQQA